MKQRITIEQLNELADTQKDRLREWWEPAEGDKFYNGEREEYVSYLDGEIIVVYSEGKEWFEKQHCLPLLSIGQMINLLSQGSSILSFHRYDDCNGDQWNVRGTLYRKSDRFIETLTTELCDALWEAVKKST